MNTIHQITKLKKAPIIIIVVMMTMIDLPPSHADDGVQVQREQGDGLPDLLGNLTSPNLNLPAHAYYHSCLLVKPERS